MTKIQIKENSTERLDSFVMQYYPDCTRSQIKKMIEEGVILVNQKKSKQATY